MKKLVKTRVLPVLLLLLIICSISFISSSPFKKNDELNRGDDKNEVDRFSNKILGNYAELKSLSFIGTIKNDSTRNLVKINYIAGQADIEYEGLNYLIMIRKDGAYISDNKDIYKLPENTKGIYIPQVSDLFPFINVIKNMNYQDLDDNKLETSEYLIEIDSEGYVSSFKDKDKGSEYGYKYVNDTNAGSLIVISKFVELKTENEVDNIMRNLLGSN